MCKISEDGASFLSLFSPQSTTSLAMLQIESMHCRFNTAAGIVSVYP